jgi:hypothetical protein
MAVQTGQRRGDNIASSQREIDLSKEILLLEPDAAPITVVLKQIYNGGRSRPAVDPLFSWHEDALEGRFDAVNDATPPVAADTAVTVDTGTLFAAEDLVYVPRTGEVFLVESISTNDLTIVRGVGATTAADFADDDELYIIGTADNEGDTSVEARSENPTKVDNYTQIFKHSVKMSGSLLSSSNMSSPHDWNHQRRKTAIEHLKDIELAFILGSPSSDETFATGDSAGERRTTGGLLHFCDQNVTDASGALTEVEFETWLRGLFRYGSQTRTLFASPLLVSVLNGFSQTKLQTVVGAETYGVKVMNWISPHGEVKIVKHNLLEGTTLSGYGIAVDYSRSEIAYRYLKGDGPGGSRDTFLRPNVQANDLDGRQDEWISECGLQVGLPKLHGVLKGVTS